MTDHKAPGKPPAKRSRPYIKDYGIPKGERGMLDWSFVSERMAKARNYWIATTRPDGRPHVSAVWGVWLDDALHFGGGPDTRRARNLKANPAVAVHLESADEVVIIEGTAQIIDPSLQDRVDDAYERKYGMRHGPFVWAVTPHKVFAWKEFPNSVTRWTFED